MSDLIRRSLDPAIQVEISHSPDLPPARVDPNQLELAILNLAINARDAMPGGGKLRIRADSVPAHDGQGGEDCVRIVVQDNGIGMDERTLARAVEPFFSTKGVGKGTGLGLSMVHGLAAQLGGSLHLDSRPGKGTTAEILLPVADEPANVDEPTQRVLVTAARRAAILLVDDEDLVRVGTSEMLADLGYKVVAANSGAEALRLLRSGEEFDMMITDYLMPGMNGVELVEEAKRLAPDMIVMLVTGYSTIAEGPGSSLPRLAKPFRQADLAEFVADLLVPRGSRKVVPLRPDRAG
jgi:CheY-like chemotaxis protein